MGCSKCGGESAPNAGLQSITDAIRNGDKVVLTGFGTFETREVKGRMVRPVRGANRGELIENLAHKSVCFRPAKVWTEDSSEGRTDTSSPVDPITG